jgi:DNA topoisomerase-1
MGCSNYPECKSTYSLPPNALIKKSDKVCEKCNWPMLMSIKKAKRPWIFCFNPGCETNRDWAKKRQEKAESQEDSNSSENSS